MRDCHRVPSEPGGVVLSGGSSVRFQGADKASMEVGGATLLEHVLGALADVAGRRGRRRRGAHQPSGDLRREDPAGGGPAAGLLAGLVRVSFTARHVVVLAVDMPLVTTATVSRLLLSVGEDGALLVDEDGRRQYLCAVYRTAALLAAAPPPRTSPDSRSAGSSATSPWPRSPPRGRRPRTSTPGKTSSACVPGSETDSRS